MSCPVQARRKTRMMAGDGCGLSEPRTPANAELSSKLAQMKAEREKQDCMWQAPIEITASQGGNIVKRPNYSSDTSKGT